MALAEVRFAAYHKSEYERDLESEALFKIRHFEPSLSRSQIANIGYLILFYEITNRCSYMQSILFHC